MNMIKDCKLEKEYISKFHALNNANINYSSIYFSYQYKNDINYLKYFNINFNQLKRLTIYKY